MKRLIHSKGAVGFWFILPAVLLTATIFLVPFYRAFETSLHRLLLYRPNRTAFIGFDNYWRLLTRDEAFRNSVVLTAIFVVATVILVLIVALLTSGLLVRNRVRRGYSPVADKFQIFLLLPFLMTPAVSGTIFRVFIWDFDTGIANCALTDAQVPPQPMLGAGTGTTVTVAQACTLVVDLSFADGITTWTFVVGAMEPSTWSIPTCTSPAPLS